MADALLGQLFQNLESLIRAEIGLLWGVEEDLKKLSRRLSAIRLVVQDAERKQSTNDMIDLWLRELKDAVYDADDVLDLWATEVQLSQRELTSNSRIKQVSASFLACFPFNQVVFRHKIAKKITKARDQFEDIFKEMSNLNLVTISTGGGGERGSAILDPTRETSSLIYEPHVYGRDEDKDKIVDMLIGNANDVSFLAILGIGGLGKTTLAQLVYNDERVEKHFDERIWICVSDDFSVQRLTRLTVKSLSSKSPDLETLEDLQNEMKKLLSGKRFLLMLDDVWNEDQNEWNKLKASLTTCRAKGSSIVLTTRLRSVASIMDDASSVVYPLRPLSENECWSLFEVRALGVGEKELPRDILEIGKQIVNNCRGVPLAAKVLGGLMRSRREVTEWESIRDNDLWKLPEGDAIMGILRLSYNHLHPQLKQCFNYCSIFPKDYVINKEELIQMWIANGFVIQPVVSGMELEGSGNQSFDELLQGSFFQDVEKDKLGEIESCKIHDLMHDLACHVSDGECCSLEVGKETRAHKNMRHLLVTGSLQESSSSTTCHSLCKSNKSLRTLALPNHSHERSIDIIMKSKLNYLRVLNLSKSLIDHLPTSVGHMKCLRYLNLSHMYYLKSLPKSICRLIHLQTLKLEQCFRLEKLPEEMKSMRQLRHLDIRGCNKLTEMPSEMGQLTCLHTLSFFIVDQETGRRINELKGMKHLGGELKLRRLDLVEDATEAKESNLVSKRNLSSLELSWGYDWGLQEKKTAEEVLECLQPHPGVKEVVVIGYPGARFPSWIIPDEIGNLTALTSLRIEFCKNLKSIPDEIGNLTTLTSLEIKWCGELISLPAEGLQKLTSLNLTSLKILKCDSLKSVPEMGIQGANNSLKSLSIDRCEGLTSLSGEPLRYLSSLQTLSIHYCNNLELSNEAFQHLVSLRDLSLYKLPKMTSVPDVQNLTALQSLRIWRCLNVRRLPQGLQHLTSLQTLHVSDCHPDLHKRMEKGKGEDWPMISHIPNIKIND